MWVGRVHIHRCVGVNLQYCLSTSYHVQVIGMKNVLIDYYVSARDTKGNMKKTDISHVYVGSGNVACNG